jgi:hypothetical protein
MKDSLWDLFSYGCLMKGSLWDLISHVCEGKSRGEGVAVVYSDLI